MACQCPINYKFVSHTFFSRARTPAIETGGTLGIFRRLLAVPHSHGSIVQSVKSATEPPYDEMQPRGTDF